MQQPDLEFQPVQFQLDPTATAQMAALVSKLQDILREIYDNLGSVKVLSAAPAVGEVFTVGDGKGNTLSEIVILDDGTQTNRKLYYKNANGDLRLIDSA